MKAYGSKELSGSKGVKQRENKNLCRGNRVEVKNWLKEKRRQQNEGNCLQELLLCLLPVLVIIIIEGGDVY